MTMRVIVNVLAAYRLLRLLQIDAITRPHREWLHRKTRGSYWNPLIECPWCLSVWLCGAIVLVIHFLPALWNPIAGWLAFAAVVGFLGYLDQEHIS